MVEHEKVAPFRYMVWAKTHHAGASYHLGMSGLPPPEMGLLSLPGGDQLDLAQRGYDMPPAARRRLAARFGVVEDRLLLTLGSSHALYLVCASLLRAGDLCLVETPAYELLTGLPALHAARVERFERSQAAAYRLPADLPATIRAKRPRLVLLTNPHNPSGALLSLEELADVSEAVRDAGSLLVVDEVYLEYLPDSPARSAHQLGDHVLCASSFTKAFGLGTVRFGWLIGHEELIEQAIRYNDYISVLYPNPAAWVGMAALDVLEGLQQRAQRIRQDNLPIAADWIASQPEVSWHPPEAGVVGLVRLHQLPDTTDFCERLLAEQDTLLVPGRFFEAPGHVRLGFGVAEPILREGLARLSGALEQLRPDLR